MNTFVINSLIDQVILLFSKLAVHSFKSSPRTYYFLKFTQNIWCPGHLFVIQMISLRFEKCQSRGSFWEHKSSLMFQCAFILHFNLPHVLVVSTSRSDNNTELHCTSLYHTTLPYPALLCIVLLVNCTVLYIHINPSSPTYFISGNK